MDHHINMQAESQPRDQGPCKPSRKRGGGGGRAVQHPQLPSTFLGGDQQIMARTGQHDLRLPDPPWLERGGRHVKPLCHQTMECA